MGLPNLPLPPGFFPRRPASTSQLPNGNHAPLPNDPQTQHPPNLPNPQHSNPFPQLSAQGQFPYTRSHFINNQQPFNTAPVMNAHNHTMFAPPQFNVPFPGAPFPWFPSQNLQAPNMNTLNNFPSAGAQDENRGEERAGPDGNLPSSRTESASQAPEPGSNSTQATNTTQGATPGSDGAHNNLGNVGQWRISINQTTFHSGNPMQNSQLGQTLLGPAGGLPTPPRQHFANLPDAVLRNHLQQLRSQASNLTNSARNQNQAFPSTLAYLLSSPTGPQALLVSPAGSFASSGYGTAAANIPLFALPVQQNGSSHFPPFPQQVQNLNTQPGQQATPPTNEQQDQRPQRPQLQQQDQVGELLRILLPLGGHLWLLVRLCGFVYLFSSDRGWRNTFLLGICALIVFAAQTRILEPLLQYVWNPIRRHVEALVHVDQPVPQGPPAQRDGASSESGNPTSPQAMAERLAREQRGRQNNNIFRAAFSRLERSFALFVASLVPGVGERHVAAQQAAARQQREREETARQEEERERQRQEQDSLRTEDLSTGTTVMAQTEQQQGPAVR